MSEHKLRVSAKGVVFNDQGKVLVVNEAFSHWSFPGGGVEDGEKVKDAVIREIIEETGYFALIDDVIFTQDITFTNGTRQIELFFRGTIDPTQKPIPEHEREFAFVNEDEYMKLVCLPKELNPFRKLGSVGFNETILR